MFALILAQRLNNLYPDYVTPQLEYQEEFHQNSIQVAPKNLKIITEFCALIKEK